MWVGWVGSEFEARFASAACMDCTFIGEGFAIYCSTRGCSEWCVLTDEGRQSIIQNHKPNMCSELQTRLLSACRTQDVPPSRRVAYCLPSFYLLPSLSAVHVGSIRFVEILWIYIASLFTPSPPFVSVFSRSLVVVVGHFLNISVTNWLRRLRLLDLDAQRFSLGRSSLQLVRLSSFAVRRSVSLDPQITCAFSTPHLPPHVPTLFFLVRSRIPIYAYYDTFIPAWPAGKFG